MLSPYCFYNLRLRVFDRVFLNIKDVSFLLHPNDKKCDVAGLDKWNIPKNWQSRDVCRWNMALDKDHISNQEKKKKTKTDGSQKEPVVVTRNKRSDLYLTPHTQVNPTWVKDQNFKKIKSSRRKCGKPYL